MQPPRLTFACELDRARLTELFADGSVLADLRTLRARVTLMLSDLSSERAAVVRQLNDGGVPVVAIPLLPFEEGYYFTADNPDRAAARYTSGRRGPTSTVWCGTALAWTSSPTFASISRSLTTHGGWCPWSCPAWVIAIGRGEPPSPMPGSWPGSELRAGRSRTTSSR